MDFCSDNIIWLFLGATIAIPAAVGVYEIFAKSYVDGKKAEAGVVLQEGRYNDNDRIDKFYVIDGEKVPLEVDGRPAREYFPDTK